MAKIKIYLILTVILSLALASSAWSQDGCDHLLKEEMYQEDWDVYLNCLETEVNEVEREVSSLDTELEQLENEVNELKQERGNLSGEAEAIQKRISEIDGEWKGLQDILAELKALPTEYTVAAGDNLAGISGKEDIYRDPAKWPRIYHANKYIPRNKYGEARVGQKANGGTYKMTSPNMIYPGWILKIPRDWPSDIRVVPGDCLWKISGFWWVNDNPVEWRKIHKMNDDQIRDPDLIYPNQVFKIRDMD